MYTSSHERPYALPIEDLLQDTDASLGEYAHNSLVCKEIRLLLFALDLDAVVSPVELDSVFDLVPLAGSHNVRCDALRCAANGVHCEGKAGMLPFVGQAFRSECVPFNTLLSIGRAIACRAATVCFHMCPTNCPVVAGSRATSYLENVRDKVEHARTIGAYVNTPC